MSKPQSNKKSRFDISREVQEEFVNSIAEHMFALSNEADKWQKPWYEQAPMGMPFCVTTGREYSGSNMVKLMLASVVNRHNGGYNDDRPLRLKSTFKQLESVQVANPDLKMHIRKVKIAK